MINLQVGPNASATDASSGGNNYYNRAANAISIIFPTMNVDMILGGSGGEVQDIGAGPTETDRLDDWFAAGGAPFQDPALTSSNVRAAYTLRLIDGVDYDQYLMDNFGNGQWDPGYSKGLKRVLHVRSYIGATINRLEHTRENLSNQLNNTQSAESVLRDADFAQETANFTRNQILNQAATAMLSQANAIPEGVMGLLR
jgi:flagellin-like hook-associated protein FlgL